MAPINDHRHNSSVLDENDIYFLSLPFLENMIIVFTIIHVVLSIDHLIHVFYRVYLPKSVHPTLSQVLPLPSSELDYPFVAIQLPMMNEIECCEAAIECACNLDWPKSRLLVQVLDDSSDELTKMLIDKCVQIWTDRGIQMNLCRRPTRKGFKAGNMNYGMPFISQAEYIAIFDVDFLPTKDYLLRTLPILMDDPNVAFVQARWTFTNSKETLLTRLQEITLNFHHKCEQEVRFRASVFFTFNGSGGIWQKSAMEQAGGWQSDTVVEDLDLSSRAYLNGWRFVYLHDFECLNELPPTVSGYLNQQHRWKSGPMQVARKIVKKIYRSRHISWGKKLYLLWFLFRSYIYISNVFSLVVIGPLSIFVIKKNIYNLISIYSSIIPGLCYMAFTFDEIHLILINIIFLNAMSLNNAAATISGLFNYGRAREWIVTRKFGNESENICLTTKSIGKELSKLERDNDVLHTLNKKNINQSYPYRLSLIKYLISGRLPRICNRIRLKFRPVRFDKKNFSMGVYLLIISYLAFQETAYFTTIYLFSTSIMYFILAFGYMGRQIE